MDCGEPTVAALHYGYMALDLYGRGGRSAPERFPTSESARDADERLPDRIHAAGTSLQCCLCRVCIFQHPIQCASHSCQSTSLTNCLTGDGNTPETQTRRTGGGTKKRNPKAWPSARRRVQGSPNCTSSAASINEHWCPGGKQRAHILRFRNEYMPMISRQHRNIRRTGTKPLVMW